MNKDYRYKNENRTYAVPINNLKLIWQTIPNGLFQQSHIQTPFQQNFFYNQYETVALTENYKIKSQNLYHQGMFNEALELLIKALNIYHNILMDNYPDIYITYYNLAISLFQLARYKEAYPYAQKALTIAQYNFYPNDPGIIEINQLLQAINNYIFYN